MSQSKPIYLDYNATTPIAKEVADAMVPYLYGAFGNPSSSHPFGIEAKLAVENTRTLVAASINCQPFDVFFTRGGTESNNTAIRGFAQANRHKGNHIITSQVEHTAVLEVCHFLETQGITITYLPVDQFGLVNPDDLEQALVTNTILVSIMHANNEAVAIQPIKTLVDMAHKAGAVFHADVAQSLGNTPGGCPNKFTSCDPASPDAAQEMIAFGPQKKFDINNHI